MLSDNMRQSLAAKVPEIMQDTVALVDGLIDDPELVVLAKNSRRSSKFAAETQQMFETRHSHFEASLQSGFR